MSRSQGLLVLLVSCVLAVSADAQLRPGTVRGKTRPAAPACLLTVPALDTKSAHQAQFGLDGPCDESLTKATGGSFFVRDFSVASQVEGLPQLKVSAVSEIVSRISPDRSGLGTPVSELTFECHGSKDEVKATFELFQKTGRGESFKGLIKLSLLDSGAGYSSFAWFELRGLQLVSYSPFGSLNVDDPNTLGFSFAVTSDSMTFALD